MKKINNKAALISAVFLTYMITLSFAQGAPPPAASGNANLQQAGVSDFLQEKISVDYKDVDIADILRSLSYTYGLNLVTSTDIKGKITIFLKDVLVSEALDAILSANGYNYSRKGNILYISPGSEEGAQVVTVPIILKYLKAADAQNLVRKALSNKGDIKVDEVANMLVVTDYSASVEKLKQLLLDVDQPPRQVLIEAKVVDITSKDLQNLGVTWSATYSPGHGIFDRSTTSAESMKMTGTLAGTSSTLTGGQFKLDSLVMKGLTASATIDALIQDQKAHLLASPSIAVLNNREARIIIGEKVPYKETTQTTTGTTSTTKYIDVGTTLRVTPSINADGYITLAIHPEVSSVSALLDAGPRITTREADTTVRVKEGETIVICGLIKQEDNRTRSRVPILGYIPIIEYLFSSRSSDKTQTELAVFITPKILRSRAEMLAENKTHYEEEAYVNIMSTADLNVQSKLFDKAKSLQAGSGLESRNKEAWQRKNQALSLYECIVTQFPDGPKAPESAYQAAVLYKDLGEQYLAKEMCAKVLSKYPDSKFTAKAADLQKIINARIRKDAREKAEIELAKIRNLTKEERSQEVQLQEDENLKLRFQEALEKDKREADGRARLEEARANRLEAKQRAQAQLEEERQRARIETEMVQSYKTEQAKIAKEEARKQAQNKARIEKEVRLKAAEQARTQAQEKVPLEKELRQKAAEEARIAKEESRKQADAEAAAKKEAQLKAAEQAKIAKEEARKQADAEVVAKKEAQLKAVEQAKIAKEEARKQADAEAAAKKEAQLKAVEQARTQAQEKTRIEKELGQKAAEEARLQKEEARKQAATEAAAKKEAQLKAVEQARTQAQEKARIEKELGQKAAEEARIAKEESRKQAATEAAAKKEAQLKAVEQARLQKEEARKQAATEAAAKRETQFKAAEQARLAKEEARQKAASEAAAKRETQFKAAEQARLQKEEGAKESSNPAQKADSWIKDNLW